MTPFLTLLPLLLAQPDARFVAHTVDGPQAPARLANWGEEVVALRRVETPIPPPPVAPMVRLTTGEQILLDPKAAVTLDEETLSFVPASIVPAGKATLQVPLASVTLLSLKMPATIEDPASFLMKLAREKRPRDRVILVNGDQVVGTVAGLDRAGNCTMMVEAAVETIPPARLGILALNTELQTRPRVRAAYHRLILTTGDRIHLTSAQLDADGAVIRGQTLFGQKVTIPSALLAALSTAHGNVDYLSELPPAKYEATPFLGLAWPLFRDEDGRGGLMRIGGDVYDRGLALHSPSEATYTLDRKYRVFEAVLAVAGAKGRVHFEVLVDGQASKIVPPEERTASDAPLPIRIDVRVAKTLTLRARLGTLGDVQAMSLWGDARLVR